MSAPGKWGDPAVPKEGWHCLGVSDLGETTQVCAMCEVREIRYVHHMMHPFYLDDLDCGCICAGHMEGNVERARAREAKARNAAAALKRARQRSLTLWKHSRAGNPYAHLVPYHAVVFPVTGGWSGRLEHEYSGRRVKARRVYPTPEEAQLAAYDAVRWLETNLNEEA
jgi:hypothetical protein